MVGDWIDRLFRLVDGSERPTWDVELKQYGCSPSPVFTPAFLEAQAGRRWAPETADTKAAALLHLELTSRISTQEIGYSSGVETSALESLRALFDRSRTICIDHPGAVLFETLTWFVLNHHVRPFTSRWHRRNTAGGLRALDDTDEFRIQLAELRLTLRRFDHLLMKLRGDAEPREIEREEAAAIREEMARPLLWGLASGKTGDVEGMPGATSEVRALEERAAIDRRRIHYGLQSPSDRATGLALSGGGIRSATFALGVLSVFSRKGILPQFDYVSSVSGGGYLGAFLTNYLESVDGVGRGRHANEGVACQGDAAKPSDTIGLRPGEKPFEVGDRDSQMIGGIRQNSRYLASGPVWDRWSIAIAQAGGLLNNLLALSALGSLVACVLVLIEPLWSGAAPIDQHSPAWTLVAIPLLTILLSPLLAWWGGPKARWPDLMLLTVSGATVALLAAIAWHGVVTTYTAWVSDKPERVVAVLVAPLLVLVSGIALGRVLPRSRPVARWIARAAAPALLLAIVVNFAWFLRLCSSPRWFWGSATATLGLLIYYFVLLDLNVTGLHRHYRRKLTDAFLIVDGAKPGEIKVEDRLLTELARSGLGPYPIFNCALNVPASKRPAMRGRLTDFFSFTPDYTGSLISGYYPTSQWEEAEPDLTVATAMAISGAAISPQMGLQNQDQFSFWLALLNVRLGYWLRRPDGKRRCFVRRPALWYLLRELIGKINERSDYLNLSDGGHIENLGIYELLRRRCKFIVAVDGEQDQHMTFHAIANLQRLASIDLGVRIDIDLEALRLDENGLSRSHFQFCRIHYPDNEIGYLVYLKLSLTGNEGEFLRRFKTDEPDFPHHPTADQNFTEARFEAYRSLGQHVGEKLFVKSIVGDIGVDGEVSIDEWFARFGCSFLDPAPSGTG